jgi:hypothetical protein
MFSPMKHQIPRCAILIAALVSSPAIGGAQGKVDRRIASNSAPSVRIEGLIGTLRVTAWKHDSVALTGFLSERLQLTGGVAVEQPDPRFLVEPRTNVKINVQGAVSPKESALDLQVPPGARVWIKTVNGDISVDGVEGGVDINVIGGSVQVSGAQRYLNIESMDGGVTINGAPRWLRVKTADGNITMNGTSDDAAFSTVSGVMRVQDGQFNRAKFESVSGAITFAGELAPGGVLDFGSHNGPIELRLGNRLAGASIEVTSISGTIVDSITFMRPNSNPRGQNLSTILGGWATVKQKEPIAIVGKVAGTKISQGASGMVTVQSYKGAVLLKPR